MKKTTNNKVGMILRYKQKGYWLYKKVTIKKRFG